MRYQYSDGVRPSVEIPDIAIVQRIRAAESLDDAIAARNELVRRYVDVARNVALRVVPQSRRCFLDDAQQEACCALIEAAARFRPESGIPFVAWARVVMVRRIRDYLRLHGHQAKADRLGRAINRIGAYLSETGMLLEDMPDGDISRGCGLPVRVVRQTRPWMMAPVELDAHIDDTPVSEFVGESSLSGTDSIARSETAAQLRRLLEALDPRDRYLVVRVFGLDGRDCETIHDAVAPLGFSRQRGSVRLKRALKQLRESWRD